MSDAAHALHGSAAPDLAGDLARVEDELLAAVRTDDALLTEMASHLIQAGGKRQRPLFALAAGACASTFTGPPLAREVLLGGVSVELVHLGSLYHDDVIDEAVTRRTVESVNARWGNLRAILAGDFLLARASEIAAGLGTEVAGLLAATIAKLCEGEVRELEAAYRTERTEASYLASIEGKTASLFSAAARIGGIVADLPRPQIDALTEFGRCYGMAFQIVDDILDLTATAEELGKPAAHDLVEGVYTLPVLQALEGPNGDALRKVLGSPIEGEELAEARRLVLDGDAIAQACDSVRGWVHRADASLDDLADRPGALALFGITRTIVDALPE
jgi:heptaprenyl diphosphate synthase